MSIELEEKRLTLKQKLWLKYYFELGNKTEAARRAGYKCKNDNEYTSIGSQNYVKLRKYIEQWLDETGLSDVRLKEKLNELLDAKEIKFFAHEGKVTDQKEVDAYMIQKGALDIAFKVKGKYASTKIEAKIQKEESLKELEEENERLEKLLEKMNDQDRNTKKDK